MSNSYYLTVDCGSLGVFIVRGEKETILRDLEITDFYIEGNMTLTWKDPCTDKLSIEERCERIKNERRQG